MCQSSEFTSGEVGETHSGGGGAAAQLGMNIVRDVAYLQHLGHMNMQHACRYMRKEWFDVDAAA